MVLSALPSGAFGIKPEWLQQPQQGRVAIEAPDLPAPRIDLNDLPTLPNLSTMQAEKPKGRGFGRSDDFYSGLLKGGAALLSGQGLGGWAGAMGDSLELFRKRGIKSREAIDPSKYAFQVTDPETGEQSIEINEELRQAYLKDLATKGTIVKPMSEYQSARIEQTGDHFDRRLGFQGTQQDERVRHNRAMEQLMALGYDRQTANMMLTQGLNYGREGAEPPPGYSLPMTGGQVQGNQAGGFDSVYDGFVKPTEGGYTARDGRSGAPANFGINQRANPDIDVRSLTPETARQVYKDRYWGPSGADQIQDPRLQGIHFDTAVNMGVETSKRILEQSGGDPERYMALREARHRSLGGSEQGTWAARNQNLRQYSGIGGRTAPVAPQRLTVPRIKVNKPSGTTAPKTFTVGQSINGHTFKGGDPKDRANWS